MRLFCCCGLTGERATSLAYAQLKTVMVEGHGWRDALLARASAGPEPILTPPKALGRPGTLASRPPESAGDCSEAHPESVAARVTRQVAHVPAASTSPHASRGMRPALEPHAAASAPAVARALAPGQTSFQPAGAAVAMTGHNQTTRSTRGRGTGRGRDKG